MNIYEAQMPHNFFRNFAPKKACWFIDLTTILETNKHDCRLTICLSSFMFGCPDCCKILFACLNNTLHRG